MPTAVSCPDCRTDSTYEANEIIARQLQSAPPKPAARPAIRLATAVRPAAQSAPPASARSAATQSLLERTTFFVKERVAFLKLADIYDILDPATSQGIGVAKEEPPAWAKYLRLLVNKQLLPTAVNIYESETQPPVLSIHRGFTFLRSKIRVVAGDGRQLGYFRSKLLSIGGGFYVFDHQEQQVAEVKGDWKGWNFKFLNQQGREIGAVTKKWAGLGKELFTSADNYIISLTDVSGSSPDTGALLLAAGLAIDIAYKEKQ